MRATTTTLSMSSHVGVSPLAVSLWRREGGKTKAADPSLPARSLSRLTLRDLFQFRLSSCNEGRALPSLFSNLAPRPVGGTIPPQASFRNAIVSSAPTAR